MAAVIPRARPIEKDLSKAGFVLVKFVEALRSVALGSEAVDVHGRLELMRMVVVVPMIVTVVVPIIVIMFVTVLSSVLQFKEKLVIFVFNLSHQSMSVMEVSIMCVVSTVLIMPFMTCFNWAMTVIVSVVTMSVISEITVVDVSVDVAAATSE